MFTYNAIAGLRCSIGKTDNKKRGTRHRVSSGWVCTAPKTKKNIIQILSPMSVPTANQTPIGNTGSPCQGLELAYQLTSHLDWISVTGRVEDLAVIPDLMDKYFGTSYMFEDARPKVIGRQYDGFVVCPLGTSFAWVNDGEDGRYSVRLEVTGKPLNHIRSERLHQFCREIYSLGLMASRLDWAIDDYSKRLDLNEIEKAGDNDNYVGFHTFDKQKSKKKKSDKIGSTLYFGSTQSDKRIRFYDKSVESLGVVNSIRMEGQFRSEIAYAYWREYCEAESVEAASKKLSKMLVGNIRFIERDDDRTNRAKILEWWSEFVDAVGGSIKVSVPRLQPMISDKIRWVETQVAATIGVIFRCQGFDRGLHWLEAVIRRAISRHTHRHDKFVEVWRRRRSKDVEYGVA